MATNKKGSVLGSNALSAVGAGKDILFSKSSNNVANRQGVTEIDIQKIAPSSKQTRKSFDEEALKQLAESIKSLGVISPISVLRKGIDSYELIYGERRLRASKIAGLEKIPAYIRTDINDEKQLIIGVIENLQREDLDPIEIAQSYQRLIEEANLTQDELGKKIGKNRTTIANSLRLLKLPPEIQTALMNKDSNQSFTEGHAKALLSLDDENMQRDVFTTILDKGLSVRETEDLVRSLKEGKKAKKKTSKSEEQKALQTKISKKFNNAKVALNVTAKGNGKISISFANADEMNAIIAQIEKIQ